MTLILAVHVFMCIFMVVVILVQPGKGDGSFGVGGGSSQSIFGSKGAGNFLTKTTSVCATLFLLTSFLLGFPKCTGVRQIEVKPVEPPKPTAGAAASPVASPAASPVASPAASPAKKAPAKGK